MKHQYLAAAAVIGGAFMGPLRSRQPRPCSGRDLEWRTRLSGSTGGSPPAERAAFLIFCDSSRYLYTPRRGRAPAPGIDSPAAIGKRCSIARFPLCLFFAAGGWVWILFRTIPASLRIYTRRYTRTVYRFMFGYTFCLALVCATSNI